MPSTLDHINALSLFVEDLQAAKAFYQAVFGVAVAFEDENSTVLQFDKLLINLLHVGSAAEIIAPGLVAGPQTGSRFQLSIWVADVDAVCIELQRRGVTLLNGPLDRPWGMRTANFVDPAGHSWEIGQRIAAG